MRILRKEYGLKPQRSGEKVESRKQLTPDDYGNLMKRNGLTIVRQSVDTVPVPIEGWKEGNYSWWWQYCIFSSGSTEPYG